MVNPAAPSSSFNLIIAQQMRNTALLDAVLRGDELATKSFIDAGGNIDLILSHGMSLLHVAAEKGYLNVCKVLVAAGISVNTISKGPEAMPVLTTAVIANHAHIVKWLLESGAAPELQDGIDAKPLSYALLLGKEESADELVAHNCAFENVVPYVIMLSKIPRPDALKLLLKYKPPLNILDKSGNSALHYCAFFGFIDSLELLMQAGADVDIRCSQGQTPLFTAVHHGHDDFAHLLLAKYKADAAAVSSKLSTPLMEHYASSKPIPKTLPLLIAADQGLTDTLATLRMVGHRFHIDGDPFTSGSSSICVSFVLNSLREYLKGASENGNQVLRKAYSLLESFYMNIENPSYILQQAEKGLPAVLIVNWPNHYACMGSCYGINFRCNRGARLNDYDAGISIDSIGQTKKIADAYSMLVSMSNYETAANDLDEIIQARIRQSIHFFYNGIVEFLDLKHLGFYSQETQDTGNCGFIVAQQVLRLCCIMVCMDPKKTEIEDVFNHLNEGLREYHQWSTFDRTYCLQLLERIAKDPRLQGLIDIDGVYRKILEKNTDPSKEYLRNQIYRVRPHLGQ